MVFSFETVFVPDGFPRVLRVSTETRAVECGCVCVSVCDAWVCTDHEIYVVAVIVA